MDSPFKSDISSYIWDAKYRWFSEGVACDQNIKATWQRVARSLASVEKDQSQWEEQFFKILNDFQFLPGGRILANAGTDHHATLFNCFVMGQIEDSMSGIFDGLKEGAITMQLGGGVGYDFSPLRPKGVYAKRSGRVASGPVSFMKIWNTMCGTILSVGARRGAMMATLRCDHPDIEDFVESKHQKGELNHFNLSVLITNDFMNAVREDKEWLLVFPEKGLSEKEKSFEMIERSIDLSTEPVRCRIFKKIKARELWNKILKSTYDYSEPGVLFIDRINELNNLWYKEKISATNPCGEIPLPPYGACDLGSLNLTAFVEKEFTKNSQFDWERFKSFIPICVRMLDNVIDISKFPMSEQATQARNTRRIGLGITGLGDALALLGLSYGEDRGREFAEKIMRTLCEEAYKSSIALAQEKGSFPFYKPESFLKGEFVKKLPVTIQKHIQKMGIRNSHLIAIAPAGTISLLANNISSGIEPIFNLEYSRKILQKNGQFLEYKVQDYAYKLWKEMPGKDMSSEKLETALSLSPVSHLKMQAALQPYVDNSISKTVNVSEDISFEEFCKVYDWAYDWGLKGCTTFRSNEVTGCVLGC